MSRAEPYVLVESFRSRRLIPLIVAVAILLALLHIVMFATLARHTLVFPFPWTIATLNAFIILISASVSFLALMRYSIGRQNVGFWTGIGFAGFGVGWVFYLLAWPGLLSDGRPFIGRFPGTAAWMGLPVLTILGVALLMPTLSTWPDATALPGRRWLWFCLASVALALFGGAVTVLAEGTLPLLVDASGAMTPLAVAWGADLFLLFGVGSLLSARLYIRTGDVLPGYVSFSQIVISFAMLMATYGKNRYGFAFFVDRFVLLGGFLIMHFGLLSEYVRLFRSEHQKTAELERAGAVLQENQVRLIQAQEHLKALNAELEARVIQRTAHLQEKQSELALRNAELQEAHQSLERQMEETVRAMEEVHRRDRMLSQQGRLAAMGELLMNIAHHWRQPLNHLGLIVQELGVHHQFGGTDVEATAKVTTAMEVIDGMSRTINDFAYYYRSDHAPVQFLVNDLLTKLVHMVNPSFAEVGVAVQLIADADVFAYGNPTDLYQAILNILLNARDAFLAGSVSGPCVSVRLFREGKRGVILIADNAGGVAEAILEKIFDPYFSTKDPRAGTGLGLYMAKSAIERKMNGSLTVRNCPDGAEFRIEL